MKRSAVCLAVSCAVLRGDVAPKATEAPRDLYVLTVGVEGHYPETVSDLNAQDARYVRQALLAAEPFYRQVHSRAVWGTRATRRAVLESLAWLVDNVKPQDVAIVFFACHGNATDKGHWISLARDPDGDAELDGMWGTELKTAVSKVKGQPIVLIDSCYSGLLIPAGSAVESAALIVSCEADAISAGQIERGDRPSGFFVIAFCEALSGLADSDHDRVVTFKELSDYLPARAQALFPQQRAVLVRPPAAESIPLAQVGRLLSPQQLWTPQRPRNPFGWPDVHNPDGADVHRFAAQHPLPGGDKDPNAAAWPSATVPVSDTLEGEWFSRWNSNAKDPAAAWSTGRATIRMVSNRVYILYEEGRGNRHLIEATRVGADLLVGRYIDPVVRRDSTPWAGRIIDGERIDGRWGEGRWDFRRRFAR